MLSFNVAFLTLIFYNINASRKKIVGIKSAERAGRNVKTSAQIFDVTEEFMQNHGGVRESEYNDLDAEKYNNDMYAVDTANKDEMKDIRDTISDDEGSYYSSTQNSSST